MTARHDLPHRLDDEAGHGRRGADPRRGVRLRLDEPVDPLLPELADRRVLRAARRAARRHRAGAAPDHACATCSRSARASASIMAPPGAYPIQKAIAERGPGTGPPAPRRRSPDEWMRRLGALPLVHQPGEKWLYHTGSDVLGVLIARASGRSFEDVPARAHLRAAGHERHRLQRARREARPPGQRAIRRNSASGALELFDDARDEPLERAADVPVRRRRARLDRRRLPRVRPHAARPGRAPARADPLAAGGRADDDRPAHARSRRPRRRSSSATIAAGASASPSSRAATAFGVARAASAGTAATARRGYSDPREDLVGILLTQRLMDVTGAAARCSRTSGPRRIRRSTTERAAGSRGCESSDRG